MFSAYSWYRLPFVEGHLLYLFYVLVVRLFIMDFLHAVSPCAEMENNFKLQSEQTRRRFVNICE